MMLEISQTHITLLISSLPHFLFHECSLIHTTKTAPTMRHSSRTVAINAERFLPVHQIMTSTTNGIVYLRPYTIFCALILVSKLFEIFDPIGCAIFFLLISRIFLQRFTISNMSHYQILKYCRRMFTYDYFPLFGLQF